MRLLTIRVVLQGDTLMVAQVQSEALGPWEK